MNGRIILPAAMAAILLIALPLSASAQTATRVEKAVVAEPVEATRKAERQVLRISKTQGASATDDIALPDGGGTLDYTCASGNCSCAGAKDCVDMKKICAPKTMSCNDHGCTCAENPDSGDDGG